MALENRNLSGKLIAISGGTGGIGMELCGYIAELGGEILLLDRNSEKSERLISALKALHPSLKISRLSLDLSREGEVIRGEKELSERPIDFLIFNAGAYSIPREKTELGLENVYTINFLSPYYLAKKLLPQLKKRNGRIIAVGSIAYRYGKFDKSDIDFSKKKSPSRIYGNAKRQLMASLYKLFEREADASLSVVHPGITLTGITAHYPKLIFSLIKPAMRVLFMSPKKAALSVFEGLFSETRFPFWIGPRLLDIWGLPKKRRLWGISEEEMQKIYENAENLYDKFSKI